MKIVRKIYRKMEENDRSLAADVSGAVRISSAE